MHFKEKKFQSSVMVIGKERHFKNDKIEKSHVIEKRHMIGGWGKISECE